MTTDEFAKAVTNFARVATNCDITDDLIDISSSTVANSDYIANSDYRVWSTVSAPAEICKTFTCRCCGTHFLAKDPGFIPNCHNCGSVMQMD